VRFAVKAGRVRADSPLLVLGMRNNLVNLRAPVIWRGEAYAVSDEDPTASHRPYFGLGLKNGRLVCERALGDIGTAAEWPEFFCAGVPVLWDDLAEPELFDCMLTEAADHSHLFDLPRGASCRTTDASLAIWTRLHEVFTAHAHSDLRTAAAALRTVINAVQPPLIRCDDYFHAALGNDTSERLVCLFGHARLEDLGRRLNALGCRHGVCVENSGSVTPTWCPCGAEGPMIPLIRAPNFRDRGRAVLILELADAAFGARPSQCLAPGDLAGCVDDNKCIGGGNEPT